MSARVSELPLAQRDTYQLLQLQPGVQSQLGVDSVYGSDRAGVVSVNGGRGRDNNFTVNGGDGNDQFANLARDSALAGQHRGISRADQYLRRGIRPQFRRGSQRGDQIRNQRVSRQCLRIFPQQEFERQGLFRYAKLDYLQNQFGATFGGPIKKDKTFFFVTFEGDRIRKGTSSDTVAVPTARRTSGRFSGARLRFAGRWRYAFLCQTAK